MVKVPRPENVKNGQPFPCQVPLLIPKIVLLKSLTFMVKSREHGNVAWWERCCFALVLPFSLHKKLHEFPHPVFPFLSLFTSTAPTRPSLGPRGLGARLFLLHLEHFGSTALQKTFVLSSYFLLQPRDCDGRKNGVSASSFPSPLAFPGLCEVQPL